MMTIPTIFVLLTILSIVFGAYILVRLFRALDDLRFLAECSRKRNPNVPYKSSAVVIAIFFAAAVFLVGLALLLGQKEAAMLSSYGTLRGLF